MFKLTLSIADQPPAVFDGKELLLVIGDAQDWLDGMKAKKVNVLYESHRSFIGVYQKSEMIKLVIDPNSEKLSDVVSQVRQRKRSSSTLTA